MESIFAVKKPKKKYMRCHSCRWVRQVELEGESFLKKERLNWQCSNPDSENYGCFLNLTEKGDWTCEVVFDGCLLPVRVSHVK